MPLSFRTLRHLVPSSFRVKVTPVPELPAAEPLSPLPLPSLLPELAVAEPVEGRRAAAARTPSAALTTDEPDPTPGAGPATGPAIEAGVCGAAFAVSGAGAPEGVLGAAAVDWPTEVGPGDDGDEVLFVSCFTTADPPGVPSLLADSRTAIDGFEPPDPLTGTVVLGAALTVVLVVGATVVLGATVVTDGLSTAGALVP